MRGVSLWSWRSFLSIASAMSIISMASVGSIVSALSFFSVWSVGSVGSVASMGSIGSIGSMFAIGCSYRSFAICKLKMFSDELAKPPASGAPPPLHITRVNRSNDNDKGVVVIENRGTTAVELSDWKLYAREDDQVLDHMECGTTDVTKGSQTHLNASEVTSVELGDELDEMTVVLEYDKDMQMVAQVPKYYDWVKGETPYMVVDTIKVVIDDAVWDTMTTCTYKDKKNKADQCDYQDATCTINNATAQPCTVKRKGNSSWRDMDKKPSIKVKLESGVQAKLTFNNMVDEPKEGDSVKAYDIFRKFGVVSSRANNCNVKLCKASEQASCSFQYYVQIEEIDTIEYLAANDLDGATAWEVEGTDTHRVISPKAEIGPPAGYTFNYLIAVLAHGTLEQIWDIFDKDSVLRYYAGERAALHWKDSICSGMYAGTKGYPMNNGYFIQDPITHKVIIVPWGMDQVMVCRGWSSLDFSVYQPPMDTGCPHMTRCFSDYYCRQDYNAIVDQLENDYPTIPMDPCNAKHVYVRVVSVIMAGVFVLMTLLAIICTYRSQRTDVELLDSFLGD